MSNTLYSMQQSDALRESENYNVIATLWAIIATLVAIAEGLYIFFA